MDLEDNGYYKQGGDGSGVGRSKGHWCRNSSRRSLGWAYGCPENRIVHTPNSMVENSVKNKPTKKRLHELLQTEVERFA